MENYTVYKHINKINGKSCTSFYNAILKYGWDNFEHIVVSDNLSREDALTMEEAIIQEEKLSDNKFGYNSTKGGEHRRWTDEEKNAMSKMRRSMKGKTPAYIRDAISKGLKGNTNKHTSVNQYDKTTGNLIATYKSLTEASKVTGAAVGNISLACRGKIKTAGGFIWQYSNCCSSIDVNAHQPAYRCKTIPVEQYSKNGEFISSFSSIIDASRYTQIDQSAICKVCRGKQASAGGFVWKYTKI